MNSRQDSSGGNIPESLYNRMSEESIVAAVLAKRSTEHGPSSLALYVAVICLIWYIAVTLVSTLGYVQV